MWLSTRQLPPSRFSRWKKSAHGAMIRFVAFGMSYVEDKSPRKSWIKGLLNPIGHCLYTFRNNTDPHSFDISLEVSCRFPQKSFSGEGYYSALSELDEFVRENDMPIDVFSEVRPPCG